MMWVSASVRKFSPGDAPWSSDISQQSADFLSELSKSSKLPAGFLERGNTAPRVLNGPRVVGNPGSERDLWGTRRSVVNNKYRVDES